MFLIVVLIMTCLSLLYNKLKQFTLLNICLLPIHSCPFHANTPSLLFPKLFLPYQDTFSSLFIPVTSAAKHHSASFPHLPPLFNPPIYVQRLQHSIKAYHAILPSPLSTTSFLILASVNHSPPYVYQPQIYLHLSTINLLTSVSYKATYICQP